MHTHAHTHAQVCAPELLLTGNSIGAIRQGQLADGWLLGAVAAVATQPKLLNHLLVDWSEEWGVFTFRVFKDGKWRHVTVDDRLPAKKDSRTCLFAVGVDAVTLEGQQGKRAERVMWVALFEKAYAKAHGCYAQLAKGAVPYALKDLTAGAPQACCMRLPCTSALYVCLIRLPCTSALYVCLIRLPYASALYVCLTCLPPPGRRAGAAGGPVVPRR